MDDTCKYRRVEPRQFPSEQRSKEGSRWRRFRVYSGHQAGAVTWLDFSPTASILAATGGTRVVLYASDTLTSDKAISKFRDLAHSGSFRSDGRLLVAGTEEGVVKVFSVDDRSVLRRLEGHQRPVHVARFSNKRQHIFSGSDDATVRYWDLSEGQQISRFDGHRDVIRAGEQHPISSDVWATGGYDHVCRLWDIRTPTATMELDHGAPIEALKFLPSGTLMATAGGNRLCLWDVLSGRIVRKIEAHHKTITALHIFKEEEVPRLASASLDHHLKIYDLTTFKVIHSTRYSHPILSLASTSDGKAYAVGLSNGNIVLRTQRHKQSLKMLKDDKPTPSAVIEVKQTRLAKFNKLMRKFRYKDVLDLVLKEQDIRLVSAVVEELAARDALVSALSHRSTDDLMSLLSYIDVHLGNPQYTDHVTPLLEMLLDLYNTELAAKPLDKKLECILRSLQRELSLQIELKELKGSLEAVLCSQPR